MAQKPKYKVDTHFFPGSTDSERKSFEEGVEEGKSHPYTHAFFVGVGYGKKSRNRLLGFKNKDQREAFDRGVQACDEHFLAYKEQKSFLQRLRLFLFGRRGKPEKIKIKGKERTSKRGSKKRYRITGGTHVNKKKSAKRMTAKRRK